MQLKESTIRQAHDKILKVSGQWQFGATRQKRRPNGAILVSRDLNMMMGLVPIFFSGFW